MGGVFVMDTPSFFLFSPNKLLTNAFKCCTFTANNQK